MLETAGLTPGTNLLANDQLGADGGSLTGVDFGFGGGLQEITSGVDLGGGVYQFTNANGIYTFQADGTWTFDPTVNPLATDTTANFTYQITDGDGDTATAIQLVNVTHVNTPPVVQDTENWMSSDPSQQTASTPSYPNGYPLLVIVPTDADGNNLTVTATSVPPGVFYFDIDSYSCSRTVPSSSRQVASTCWTTCSMCLR